MGSLIGGALLGSTFEAWDFFYYGIGALLGALFVRGITQTVPKN